MLLENGIKIEKQFDVFPGFQKKETETFDYISKDASRKIESCFHKLYKIINRNKLSLWKVFNDFDKKKGSLTLQDFSLLMKKLSGHHMEITDEEIRLGFDVIDEDSSNSIEFGELNKYYSKINGIPMTNNLPYEPMQVEPNYSPTNYGGGSPPPYPPPFNQQGSSNPFQQIGQAFMQGQGQPPSYGGYNNYPQPGFGGGGYPQNPIQNYPQNPNYNNNNGWGSTYQYPNQPPQPNQPYPNQYPPNQGNSPVNPFDFIRKG
jgi:Ca2+-binding EF-hand superfamily protein